MNQVCLRPASPKDAEARAQKKAGGADQYPCESLRSSFFDGCGDVAH
jgi:hypothetical protein